MYKPIVFGRHRVLGDHLVTYPYTGVGNILTQALRSCLPMLALLFENAFVSVVRHLREAMYAPGVMPAHAKSLAEAIGMWR